MLSDEYSTIVNFDIVNISLFLDSGRNKKLLRPHSTLRATITPLTAPSKMNVVSLSKEVVC